MIYLNEKEISIIEYGGKVLSYVYRKGKMVWQAIKSCFGAGFWTNEKAWINEEPYKN